MGKKDWRNDLTEKQIASLETIIHAFQRNRITSKIDINYSLKEYGFIKLDLFGTTLDLIYSYWDIRVDMDCHNRILRSVSQIDAKPFGINFYFDEKKMKAGMIATIKYDSLSIVLCYAPTNLITIG